MEELLKRLQGIPVTGVSAIVEIILLAAILYVLLAFLRGSRGAGVLRGMLILVGLSIGFVFIAARAFELEHIVWVFEKLAALSIVAAVIIFQPELRRGLLRLGLNPLVGRFVRADSPSIEEIVEACANLSHRSMGALIAIQRQVPLNDYIERGTVLNAEITKELIETDPAGWVTYLGGTVRPSAVGLIDADLSTVTTAAGRRPVRLRSSRISATSSVRLVCAASFSSLRANNTTWSPRRASASPKAAPIPSDPPATTAQGPNRSRNASPSYFAVMPGSPGTERRSMLAADPTSGRASEDR